MPIKRRGNVTFGTNRVIICERGPHLLQYCALQFHSPRVEEQCAIPSYLSFGRKKNGGKNKKSAHLVLHLGILGWCGSCFGFSVGLHTAPPHPSCICESVGEQSASVISRYFLQAVLADKYSLIRGERSQFICCRYDTSRKPNKTCIQF